MQNIKNYSYDMVLSPWPLMMSITLLFLSSNLILMLKSGSLSFTMTATSALICGLFMLMWFNSVESEASFMGLHSPYFCYLLKSSMIMFISSEVMFFLSFFWAFFHSSISPNIELGMMWPPMGITTFNPMEMPLLNSIILLSSGASITWSHNAYYSKNLLSSITAMMLTIFLGILFSICQGIEYIDSNFSFSDSVYGSTFFLATGFHGIHVIIGTLYLTYTLTGMIAMKNSANHFISFELSAWYWHFVDVVWLFLYLSIYWWGSN